MRKLITCLGLIAVVLLSCRKQNSTAKIADSGKVEVQNETVILPAKSKVDQDSRSPLLQKLPEWISGSNQIEGLNINGNYQIEDRLNVFYLEEDFNGDEILDIAIPVFEKGTNKKGFAVIHGKTFAVFILGAGKIFNNALGDNQDYIDDWTINRERENEPGVEEETGNAENGLLILENPSIEISASEIGGGQIYWNGKEYAYFHQTC